MACLDKMTELAVDIVNDTVPDTTKKLKSLRE